MSVFIAPSILSADFANLQRDVEMLCAAGADWLHIDIMDGRFVPNISFGLPVCAAIAKHATRPLDVHLMIVEPEKYIEAFKNAGAASISVHVEACPHLHRTIQQIKSVGCLAGVALNPHTPVSAIEEVIADVDFVNVMSVNPGFGGQQFITASLDKIARLRALIEKVKPSVLIEVDGGVNQSNAAQLIAAGANVLVAGNAVFSAPNPALMIEKLKNAAQDEAVV